MSARRLKSGFELGLKRGLGLGLPFTLSAWLGLGLACSNERREPPPASESTTGSASATACADAGGRDCNRTLDGDGNASAPASAFAWQVGTLDGFKAGALSQALGGSCVTGADCQLNSHCSAPASASCEHDKCISGSALSASCDPCVADICAADPSCCPAPAAVDLACAHDACVEGVALASSCDPCVGAVCLDHPECCSGAWDASCTASVASVCGNTCGCRPGEAAFAGACYFKQELDQSWDRARLGCQARGPGWDLASIGGAAENDFVAANVSDASPTWIGFSAASGSSAWTWASADPAGIWDPSERAGASTLAAFDLGSVWSYDASGVDPGERWAAPDFDASSWSSGAGEFGFGEGDEATSFARTGASYYFRRTLTLSQSVTAATLDVLFDDGFVAFVNGTEVLRRNVTDLGHAAFASANAENANVTAAISVGSFVVGENVIAVQVKNVNANSVDLSFDARLDVTLSGSALYQNFAADEPALPGRCAQYELNGPGTWSGAACGTLADSVCEGPPQRMLRNGPVPERGRFDAIDYGAAWKYRARATDPGLEWATDVYDDTAWPEGTAQFGYGEGDEATTLTTVAPSYYFRRVVTLPSAISDATLNLVFDDGVVVYVNGVEVARRNVEDVAHAAYASRSSGDNSEAALPLPLGAFHTGDNTIAVLVKNASAASDDVSFDARLQVTLCGPEGCSLPAWSQGCVDRVTSVCHSQCLTAEPARGAAQCVPWFPGETDAACAGVDLSVGVPCAGHVPVCNHGTLEAPAGLRLLHLPRGTGQYASCSPALGGLDVGECFTEQAIPAGACIDVQGCAGLSGDREIMVNPPGPAQVPECSCEDNWSVYQEGACSAPLCDGGTGAVSLDEKPVDIILAIDNSASMSLQIDAIERRINGAVERVLGETLLDYRLILISRYGDGDVAVGESEHPACVGAPLGGDDCSDPSHHPLTQIGPRFFHYSADVGTGDALCRLLAAYSSPDELASDERSWTPLFPRGYAELLRDGAQKAFVVVTDGDVACSQAGQVFDDHADATNGESTALAFDAALRSLSSTAFGTAGGRNYTFHSIVGLAANAPASAAWPSTLPVQAGTCDPGKGPGAGYQALSILTGGVRYPACQEDAIDTVLRAIAAGAVQATPSCTFQLGSRPDADPQQTRVRLTSSDARPVLLGRVAGADACVDDAYYLSSAQALELCPATCSALRAVRERRLSVEVGCASVEAYAKKVVVVPYEPGCGRDERVQWGFLTYTATTPGDSNVQFRLRTADTKAGLASAAYVDLATAQASPDTQHCGFAGPVPCPIDLYAVLGGPPRAYHPFAQLEISLAPTSDGKTASTVQTWQLSYSCVAN